jgi:hypothetical protein
MIRLDVTCSELNCMSLCIIHVVDDDNIDLWQYCMCSCYMEDMWILSTSDPRPITIFKS